MKQECNAIIPFNKVFNIYFHYLGNVSELVCILKPSVANSPGFISMRPLVSFQLDLSLIFYLL